MVYTFMSDLDRFELFVHVAQTTNLTQSARDLQLTKAALSKQIKKLEKELHVDLFSRSGQRLHLTDQGKALLQQCLLLKKELDNTRAMCTDFHSEPNGTLHVVVLHYFAEKIIYPRLSQFLKKYSKLQLHIDSSEHVPDFDREQADIAVGFSLVAPGEVFQRAMAYTRHVMCASPSYFKKHGKPKVLNDLLKHRYIGHSAREEVCHTHLKSGHILKLKPTLILNNVAGMIECAKQDLGIVQLPHYLVEKHLQSGELVEVLKSYQATHAPVYYFYPKFRHTQPKIRCFINYFLTKPLAL